MLQLLILSTHAIKTSGILKGLCRCDNPQINMHYETCFVFFIMLCCELTDAFTDARLLSLSLESSGNIDLISEQAL